MAVFCYFSCFFFHLSISLSLRFSSTHLVLLFNMIHLFDSVLNWYNSSSFFLQICECSRPFYGFRSGYFNVFVILVSYFCYFVISRQKLFCGFHYQDFESSQNRDRKHENGPTDQQTFHDLVLNFNRTIFTCANLVSRNHTSSNKAGNKAELSRAIEQEQ